MTVVTWMGVSWHLGLGFSRHMSCLWFCFVAIQLLSWCLSYPKKISSSASKVDFTDNILVRFEKGMGVYVECTHTHTHTHTPLPHPLLPQDFFPPESACLALFSVGALFPTPASRVVHSASWELKIPHFFFFFGCTRS